MRVPKITKRAEPTTRLTIDDEIDSLRDGANVFLVDRRRIVAANAPARKRGNGADARARQERRLFVVKTGGIPSLYAQPISTMLIRWAYFRVWTIGDKILAGAKTTGRNTRATRPVRPGLWAYELDQSPFTEPMASIFEFLLAMDPQNA